MNTTETATTTALPVACITCKAEAHADCVTPTGLAAKATHIARLRDNEKALTLLADELEDAERPSLADEGTVTEDAPFGTTHVTLVPSDEPLVPDTDEEILAGIAKATEAGLMQVLVIPETDDKAAATIAAVRAHAETFAHRNGWDILIETMDDDDILAVIGSTRAVKGAVNKARKHCKALASNRSEIQSA